MSLHRQIIFWTCALLVLIVCLWLFSDILLPFLAGMVLAYFLDPVADALERLGLPRLAASLLILVVSIVGFALVLLLLLPVLGDQLVKLARALPEALSDSIRIFNESAPAWMKDLLARSGTDVPASVSELASRAAAWLGTLLGSLWVGGLALVNVLSLLVIAPVVAFYLLNDWDRMVARIDGWLPRDHVVTIRKLAREMDRAVAGFIRGQGTVCLILGTFYAIALTVVGLNFGLLIGLGAGLLTFIPFIGALLGGIVAVGTALVQFWPDWVQIGIVAGIFVAGQVVEGNFLSPKLVGDSIGLHPVWLMFALLAFGYLFGFAGLLLAVPLAAAVGVLVRFALKRYLESPLYRGASPPASDQS